MVNYLALIVSAEDKLRMLFLMAFSMSFCRSIRTIMIAL